MSTEQRDVRPFAPVAALDHLFKHARLKVGSDVFEAGATAVLEDDVFQRAGVSLELASDSGVIAAALAASTPDFEDLGLTVDDLAFAVVLSSSYLKISEFVHRVPLSQLAGAGPHFVLSGSPRPSALRTPRSGCQVDVLVYLDVQKPQVPLRPWRFGTWISRASFSLTTHHAFAGFTPKPLTAEMKLELGLPPKTVRYIVLGDESPLTEGVGEDSVEVWFDSDLLAMMSLNPKGKTSVALQRQLFVDAIAAVVAESRVSEQFDVMSWADVKDSLLGRVVALVAPKSGNEDARTSACVNYLEMVKHQPAKFMAYAEEAAGLINALGELEG